MLAFEGEKESKNANNGIVPEDDDDDVVVSPTDDGPPCHNDDSDRHIPDAVSNVSSDLFIESGDGRLHTSFSQSSSQLGNCRLPRITTDEARNRSYLFGSACSYGSLLGAEQLDVHFPGRTATVFVGTWNTNSVAEPPLNLADFVLPLNVREVADVYAIGTQENVMSRSYFDPSVFQLSEWETCLQETVGFSHIMLHSTVLGALHLAVFIRRELIWFCSEPEDAVIGTRQGTAIKTKGAVAVAFRLFGTSILFINSHMTAHDHNLKERINDYEKIRNGLEIPRRMLSTTNSHANAKDCISHFNCALWFGDLNFRLNLGRAEVLEKINNYNCNYGSLLKVDQLLSCLNQGHAFVGFKEETIRFPPSYKFDVGSNVYDSSSKRRTPAYTDRILYHCRNKTTISCSHYCSVPSIQSSDHKPVYSVFCLGLRPGRDDVPLAAGQFVRSVYLKAIERRALLGQLYRHKGSKFCSIM